MDQPLIDSLRAFCASTSRPRLALQIEHRGQPVTWTVDLIFSEGRWQCVRLVYNTATSR